MKWRALRLDTGNFSWGSEAVTRKTRLLDVVYNASNNELVRTQTLVKGAIVQVDAAPFKQWYLQHYGVEIGRKKKTAAAAKKDGEVGLFYLLWVGKFINFIFVCPNDLRYFSVHVMVGLAFRVFLISGSIVLVYES